MSWFTDSVLSLSLVTHYNYRVYTQRHLYKKRQEGQINLLTDERISILNSIDFVWNAKKDKQWQNKDRSRKIEKVKDLWQKYFDELVQYKEDFGKCHLWL